MLIDCGFDLDKMANRYGYKSFGDWYGRNIAEGSTAIALKLLSDKFKAKLIKKEGASGAGTSLKNASSSVGSKLNGTVSSVSELNNGYKIEIPNGNKPIVVRIMDEGVRLISE